MSKVKLPINLRTQLVAGPWGTGDLLYEDVVILLSLNGEDGDTTTDDKKGNDITIAGSGQLDSSQTRWGNTSYLCDGAITFSAQALVDAGMVSGNWTVEFWYRPDGTASINDRLFQSQDGDFTTGIYIAHDQISASQIGFGFEALGGGGGWDYLGSGVTISINTWQHIALVRNGSELDLYLNGTSSDSTTFSGSLDIIGTQDCIIGAQTIGLLRANGGWIDDFRITASARYTKDFTPPKTPFANYKPRVKQTGYYDQYADDIVFQLSMDGTDGGTTFTDASPNAHVFTATSATTSNEQVKFGTASMKAIDGLDYYIGTPTATITSTSTSFTMEGWIYTNGPSYFGSSRSIGDHVMFSEEKNAGNSNQFFRVSDNGSVGFFQGSGITGAGNQSMGTAVGLVPDATWTHVALVYDDPAQRMRIYVGGIKGADASWTTGGWFSQTRDFIIGASSLPSYQVWRLQMNAYVDDLRVTEAVRYRENFTPPTKAFPAL